MFAQCLDRKEQSAGDVALGVFLLGTANELYQKIWGKESLGDVRTVQVHIHNLRSKIEPDPAKPIYLKNVWGKGYVFRPDGQPEL